MKNQFSTIFLIILLFSFFLGCDKDDNPLENNDTSNITSISGRILTWTYGTDKILKLSIYDNSIYYHFATSSIDANGNFNLSNLESVPSDLLEQIILPSGVTISNSSVKWNSSKAKFKIFETGSETPILEISRERIQNNTSETIGDYYCSYRYSNGNTKITGNYTENSGAEIIEMDLNLVTGWNKVVKLLTAINQTAKTYKITNIEPDGGVWR